MAAARSSTCPPESPVSRHGACPWVNDCHSRANRTRVARLVRPACLSELAGLVAEARRRGDSLIPHGGRHAMGGQQFLADATAVDMRGLDGVRGIDTGSGIIDVEAGITWPKLLAWLDRSRSGHGASAGPHGWAIAQKQTGADELTIGGSLAANVHGRGLVKRPIIEDVESFTLIDPEGRSVECSRTENADLFALAIGGYGLFGIIASVRLRLVPRRILRRVVVDERAESLIAAFDERIADGFSFGDFQFQIDERSDGFLDDGILSCYREAPGEGGAAVDPPRLSRGAWLRLLHLAHTDKREGFRQYREHYRRTDGSLHWSDAHQFTVYVDGYHDGIDRQTGSRHARSEMISELYVPRPMLARFLAGARGDLRRHRASVIYGTVRLIERDDESFLNWAREPWACVVFNLCVEHSPAGMADAGAAFRALIDRALSLGGSFYLTYHRFASREQIEAAHPRFAEFLRRKRDHDPGGRFQSNWFRHCQALFGA